jgi:drug/metabolite transporter (DMT)-like permease
VSQKLGKIKFNKGLLYVLGIALFYGLATTNDAYLIKYVDVLSFLVIGFLFPGIFLIIVKPKALLKLDKFLKPKILAKMLILTIFYAGGAVFYYYALNTGAKASQLIPVHQSAVIPQLYYQLFFCGSVIIYLKKSSVRFSDNWCNAHKIIFDSLFTPLDTHILSY